MAASGTSNIFNFVDFKCWSASSSVHWGSQINVFDNSNIPSSKLPNIFYNRISKESQFIDL